MDKRHIAHINANTVNEVHGRNERVRNDAERKGREAMAEHAERGFWNEMKNATYTPEKRCFI